ncbi:MAG: hypothetical protein QOI11_25, partial [Candidatus Eremiobacteraeota bacterium]|nr:hypothetical protein [Candidatus Eremiobacteraeota bacterium]
EARALYTGFLGSAAAVWDKAGFTPAQLARTGVLAIFWPSKKFDESSIAPAALGPGAAAIGESDSDAAAAEADARLRVQIAELRSTVSPDLQSALDAALAQVAGLDASGDAQDQFVAALAPFFTPGSEPDPALDNAAAGISEGKSGSAVLADVRAQLATGTVDVPSGGGGGAASIGDADPSLPAGGGAAGFNPFATVKDAALMLLNLTTYYTMKERAGTIGRSGVRTLLAQAFGANPKLRAHLVGHSFGGRLVTSLANALDAGTQARTLTLLEAAYSHYGLSADFRGRGPGAFRHILDAETVRGTISITHSVHDRAVGLVYPIASAVAHQTGAAIGDASDLYGGMGRNGAQETSEAFDDTLLTAQTPYAALPAGKCIRNLDGDAIITSHGDVARVETAWALLDAMVKDRT